ncbi:uncharacterized protein LOC108484789 [Gossypium arboreum]|uniref:uncharacterized protein LOC108484789 n=1 Tax=Gossypium arboreum TaxID=29729 RepID=UPI0008191485|nr:uncharacterized protein LOC108484789 [Gossypium arboreum]
MTMDFVSGLPLTSTTNDSVWVILDQLTKFAQFLLVKTDYSLQKLAKSYISNIVRLQFERVIHVLEDMLRSYVINFCGSWEEFLPLAEFAYNNSFEFSIHMAPYRALYDIKFRTPLCWIELGKRRIMGLYLVSKTEHKVRLTQDHLKAALSRQKSYADLKRRDIEFAIGDWVFLKTSPWKKIL